MLISITTLPTRINHIEPVINSLKKQKIPIYLWIPRYVERLNMEFDGKIPEFLKGVHCEVVKDGGSLTKFMGWDIAKELFFTADDDTIVPENWAKNLLEYYDSLNKRGVCCYRGRIFKGKNKKYRNTRLIERPKEVTKVDLVMSNWGALYNSNMFSVESFVYPKEINDDIAIGAELYKKDIPIWCLPSKGISATRVCRIDSLWAINKKSKANDNAIKKLWKEAKNGDRDT